MRVINNDQISSCQLHLYTLIFYSLRISYYISNKACDMCLLESNSLVSLLSCQRSLLASHLETGTILLYLFMFAVFWIPLYCPIVLVQPDKTKWNSAGDTRHPFAVPELGGIAPGVSASHMMLSVLAIHCLHCFVIVCWWIACSFHTQFLREFSFLIRKGCQFYILSLQLLK